MADKKYLYRGKQIFVSSFDKNGFRTFFKGSCNDRHPISISELPIRNTKDEAQRDLEAFAKRRTLKAV